MGEKELSREAVEVYLKNNPEFVKSWFSSNGYYKQHGLSGSNKPAKKDSRNSQLDLGVSSGRSSITTEMFKDLVSGKKRSGTKTPLAKKSRHTLQGMSEKDLFMELVRDIANELDVNVLCHKILLNVSILTHSDRGSLFLARSQAQGGQEVKHLVSKLFDVTENSSLEDSLHTEENEIRVPFGKGIAGYVAETKDTVNIKNAYEDSRFNQEVDKQTGYRTHSILCMPILNYEDHVIGVAQIINKTTGDHEFTAADEEVFRDYLTFCGIGLTNAQLFEMSVQEYKRNQLLLGLARGIFEEQSSLELLVQKIMMESQELLSCERCVVYIIDDSLEKEDTTLTLQKSNVKSMPFTQRQPSFSKHEEVLFSKAFILNTKETPKPSAGVDENITKLYSLDAYANTLSPSEIEKSKCAKIARIVATTGETVNISDAESDPRFEGSVDDYDGFKTHTMLCLPVFNSEKHTIGIAQLMNKSNSKPFNDNDVNILHAFAIFCGLGIHNTQMYENACRLMAKQSVALEVLSYHATAQPEETDKLKNSVVPSAADFKLYTWEFNDALLTDDETLKATIRMFMECDIVNRYHVPYQVLCRWTLSVKKNYRPVIYHNWRHAFNVAQTMFTMIYSGKMTQYLNDLEVFGLLVACLCHDLDHRGTNNAFQSKVDSPLAVLYSTSTMEHHHFDHCIMILNSEGNNIFEAMSSEDYKTVIKLLEGAILSTDLALYFKKRGNFQALVDTGEKEWKDKEKKELLRGMMMTACDVAAITKPWEIQRDVAQLVASEFFEQGDIERAKLNLEPMAMMDRRKKDELPKMQVGFIDAICLPVYKMFSQLEQDLNPLFAGCQNNRSEWQALSDKHEKEIKTECETKKNTTPVAEKKEGAGTSVLENNRRNTKQSLGNKTVIAKSDVKTRTCVIL